MIQVRVAARYLKVNGPTLAGSAPFPFLLNDMASVPLDSAARFELWTSTLTRMQSP